MPRQWRCLLVRLVLYYTTMKTSRAKPTAATVLLPFGFNELESEAYLFLLRESAATAYRIAQGIRKPSANVYKAMESLEEKGAVTTTEEEARLYVAVPPAELLAKLERSFHRRREEAAAAIASVDRPLPDDRVHRLHSRELVFARMASMLEGAERVALADGFPIPLAELREPLEAAARRGVKVGVKAYDGTSMAGVRTVVPDNARETVARWPGQWINLVVDGAQTAIAYLSRDGVHQAIWTASPWLSWTYHSALVSEISLAAVSHEVERHGSIDRARLVLEELRELLALDAPGYRAAIERSRD